MSPIPSFFGPWNIVHDPFNFDSMDDPFHVWPLEVIHPAEKPMLVSCHAVWNETSAAYILKIDIPGFNKNEVKVEIEHGKVVKISGHQDKQIEEKNDKWKRVDRSHKRFVQRVKLPANAEVDEMKTGFENGVLTVTLPKKQEKKQPGRLVELS